MTYIVALTGGIGSGKSTVSEAFRRLGVPIIDADIIARQIVSIGSPVIKQIADKFGSNILLKDGGLNRTALRKIIFNKPYKRIWLNNLLHPLIYKETQRQIIEIDAPYILWVIPLLIEKQLFSHAQRVLVVDIDPKLQIKRIIMRDNISRKQVKKILSVQTTRIQRLLYADDIINNNGYYESITSYVLILHSYYLNLTVQYS
ncbi:Dephospho-CoA kinase [Candidatus Profftia lariciata]|uniref:dephospho-CoA kinase n=1 Tax=Candidatus Profftia lariciata TaxID=1987921 RepID=UPI001D011BED|nr:dephospho-CoA kinase [Candidatus Profftia lariciata]UDG81397.1 Dephospho-CoA kinase [Candidatus Profftia lariciata]